MKKIFTLLAIAMVVLQGCGGGDDAPTCSKVDSFTVTQQIDKLHYSIVSEGGASYYEISIDYSEQATAGSGSLIPVQTATGDIDLTQYGFAGNTVNVYVRSVCADGGKSKWTNSLTLAVADFCRRPSNISYSGGLGWSDNNSVQNGQYQIKYGPTGFTGNGTVITTNGTYYTGIPLAAQTSYDFYVRANCGGSDWSAWEGPYTYFSEYNENMCMQPTNATYSVVSASGTSWSANFTYNPNGQQQLEYALTLSTSTAPTTSQINAITSGYTPTYTGLYTYNTYKFWVRGVCSGGNRTPWTTITVTY